MEIISHRGYWLAADEKNTMVAFERAITNGFGIETDIRDQNGNLVIAHDLPVGKTLEFTEFLSLYKKLKSNVTLALNIKSDGLREILIKTLGKYEITNYFLFDMSVPDLFNCLKSKLICFTRQSEFEQMPLSLYDETQGVWMDCFNSDWIEKDNITCHLENNKKVCIVSSELHRRSHLDFWNKLKSISSSQNLYLCTDLPTQAKEFFNG